MDERIMSHKKFWIIRFKDRVDGCCAYATKGETRRTPWWWDNDARRAHRFLNERQCRSALRHPFWADQGYANKSEYIIEIVQIDEHVRETWTETDIITNENALIQLARLAETDEHDHDSED